KGGHDLGCFPRCRVVYVHSPVGNSEYGDLDPFSQFLVHQGGPGIDRIRMSMHYSDSRGVPLETSLLEFIRRTVRATFISAIAHHVNHHNALCRVESCLGNRPGMVELPYEAFVDFAQQPESKRYF